MKKMHLFLTFVTLFIAACNHPPDATSVLQKSVLAHGGENFNNSVITYDFREKSYKLIKNDWKFSYERRFSDTSGNRILEGMNNKGAYKFVNGNELSLSAREDSLLKYSINAVRYFSVLPLQLINNAVVPVYLGEAKTNGKSFHAIELTFRQAGGGDDYRDRYILWIDTESNLLKYFAYYYHVNGGGSRFREIVNQRNVNGLVLSDQINYTSESIDTNIENYLNEFSEGNLRKVSEVILENLKVNKK